MWNERKVAGPDRGVPPPLPLETFNVENIMALVRAAGKGKQFVSAVNTICLDGGRGMLASVMRYVGRWYGSFLASRRETKLACEVECW